MTRRIVSIYYIIEPINSCLYIIHCSLLQRRFRENCDLCIRKSIARPTSL